MHDYRAYILGPDGHIINRIDLVCRDDEDAKERAKQLAYNYAVELWERDRKIGQFAPQH
jgi:hypothetical protein